MQVSTLQAQGRRDKQATLDAAALIASLQNELKLKNLQLVKVAEKVYRPLCMP